MHRTKEIRWFFRPDNTVIKNWFDRQECTLAETRTDFYLQLNNADIGAKIREGKIELKHRIGTRARGCLSPSIWGHYDTFIKWSFDGKEDDPLLTKILNGDYEYWIPCEKRRMIVQLTEEDSETVVKPISAHVGVGCQVEYTRLKINGEIWHTVGLEWFGNKCLTLNPAIISSIFGNTKLQITQSKGYAAFLTKFFNGARNQIVSFKSLTSN